MLFSIQLVLQHILGNRIQLAVFGSQQPCQSTGSDLSVGICTMLGVFHHDNMTPENWIVLCTVTAGPVTPSQVKPIGPADSEYDKGFGLMKSRFGLGLANMACRWRVCRSGLCAGLRFGCRIIGSCECHHHHNEYDLVRLKNNLERTNMSRLAARLPVPVWNPGVAWGDAAGRLPSL